MLGACVPRTWMSGLQSMFTYTCMYVGTYWGCIYRHQGWGRGDAIMSIRVWVEDGLSIYTKQQHRSSDPCPTFQQPWSAPGRWGYLISQRLASTRLLTPSSVCGLERDAWWGWFLPSPVWKFHFPVVVWFVCSAWAYGQWFMLLVQNSQQWGPLWIHGTLASRLNAIVSPHLYTYQSDYQLSFRVQEVQKGLYSSGQWNCGMLAPVDCLQLPSCSCWFHMCALVGCNVGLCLLHQFMQVVSTG